MVSFSVFFLFLLFCVFVPIIIFFVAYLHPPITRLQKGKHKFFFILVDLKISKFLLVLHLPFLLRIQKFFTVEALKDMTEEEMQHEASLTISEFVCEEKSTSVAAKGHQRPSVKKKVRCRSFVLKSAHSLRLF